MLSGANHFALSQAIMLAKGAAKGRPFGAFRGDYRRPVKVKAKHGKAGARRLFAVNASPAHSSTVHKWDRCRRIMARAILAGEIMVSP